MSIHPRSSARYLIGCSLALALAATANTAAAQDAPIVRPGAPGQATEQITAEQAVRIADTRFSPDDVAFMQDMIHHHHQAVRMAALVEGRTSNSEIIEAAGRITASQADEIDFMQGWLRDRGQAVPDPAAHAMHAMDMPGMATPEQMAALAAASGAAFDRLFLELMIEHHEGAIEMVGNLLDQPGSAYDPVLFEFTSDVVNEQEAEVERMGALLNNLSPDPRTGLTAGFRDAGQAISNLSLVASLPKPTGFFDPANPAGLPPPVPQDEAEAEAAAALGELPETPADAERTDEEEQESRDFGERSPLLSFANTDMAFSGDMLAVGSYHGFNLYRLGANGAPNLISSVICPGGQGDVSIIGDILIMSVEQTRARVDCGLQGVEGDVSAERFRGLRVFNIADPARPRQVGQVQTCRGSHTHSVVSATGQSIIVYNSGTAGVRDEEELAGCVGEIPGDARTALFSIDVIEIPLADPSQARIIDSPRVFADKSGNIAGLWRGGDHGEGTQETRITNQCHDITTFPARNLAAGACSGNGIILDISDPRNPRRIDAVVDAGFAYWHSATFNNDGTKVLFTDEWGGGSRPRCQAHDPRDWGANAFYDIVGRDLQFRSHYKLPAAQGDKQNCVAHNGSIIPVPGRDIFVQSWYQGGISVIDFTDSANPVEIAYFDRGPVDAEHLVLGGYWSSYWYNGRIYGTEIARGLDIFALQPSEYLTANEIAAATLADQGGVFNPQQQFPVSWPDHPSVALAYVDQLERNRALPAATVAALRTSLEAAKSPFEARSKNNALGERIDSQGDDLPDSEANTWAAERIGSLREALDGIADRLR